MVAVEETALEGCFKKSLVKYQAIADVALLPQHLLLIVVVTLLLRTLLLRQVQVAVAK